MAGLVTLSDVRAHLNLDAGDTSNDGELQGFIDAMTPILTYMTGPILPTKFTGESHEGGNPEVMLFHPPILSVDAVTETVGRQVFALTSQPPGASSDDYGYSLDNAASGKLVRRSSSGTQIAFRGGAGSVVVSYTAGLLVIPPDIRMAALEDLRGLWQQTQQNSGRHPALTGGADDESWTAGPMNLFPRLEMLLDGRRRLPGIA